MKRIKSLKVKLNNGEFSSPYPLGVDAKNVDLQEGKDLEAKMNDIQDSIEERAIKNHASTTTEYGVGTSELYGHLRIIDDYNQECEDPSGTAVSQEAIKQLLEYLSIFRLIDNEHTLSSSVNTAYSDDSEPTKLFLISSFFEVKDDGSGNQTLVIK